MQKRIEHFARHHCPDIGEPILVAPIPTGKFNDSYFVSGPGRELVLRIAPDPGSVFLFYERDMMRQEPELHELLLEHTTIPVAPVVALDTSHEWIASDCILMNRLPGEPLTSVGVDTDLVFAQVGEMLAQTHRITRARYGYLGAHRPMDPQPTWTDAFVVMWSKLIDDICGVNMYSRDEGDMFRRLLDGCVTMFDGTVPASLLHMDVWHQNILVSPNGTVTGLIDWDRALWGDPEIEFAVLDYCGVSTPEFWEGYGQRRDESREARVRGVFYLLYELQKYIVIRAGRGGDRNSAAGYKRQAMQIVHQCFG